MYLLHFFHLQSASNHKLVWFSVFYAKYWMTLRQFKPFSLKLRKRLSNTCVNKKIGESWELKIIPAGHSPQAHFNTPPWWTKQCLIYLTRHNLVMNRHRIKVCLNTAVISCVEGLWSSLFPFPTVGSVWSCPVLPPHGCRWQVRGHSRRNSGRGGTRNNYCGWDDSGRL